MQEESMTRHSSRSITFALFILAVASTAGAQGIARSYEQLQLLVRPGDSVSVVDASGREASGKILELSATTLALQVDGTRLEVSEPDARTIRMRRQDPLGNGARNGFITGALFGLPAMCCLKTPGVIMVAGLYGGVGAAIGVGIDAMITRRQVIFDRAGTASGVRVSPLLSRDRRGVQLAIAF
jgi:hypothetical protein